MSKKDSSNEPKNCSKEQKNCSIFPATDGLKSQ